MTHQEFLDCVDEVARKKTELAQLHNDRKQRIAAIDEELKPRVDLLASEIKSLMTAGHKHAREHRIQIFGTEKKSAETALAFISLHESPPCLKPFASFTWKKIFERVQELERHEYIAHVPELNREKIKSDMLNKGWKKDPELKVRIVREESFNVTPKTK